MRRCVGGTGALPRRRRTGDRGAASVEFALILFPLMLIVFGIINYGDMLSVRQSVSQAASEGARAAAVRIGSEDSKRDAGLAAVKDALAAQRQKCKTGVDGCSVTFENCPGETSKRCARVKVVIAYDTLIPGFGLVLPDTLHYTAVARVS
ncbi:TadE-like protein [Nocardioides sp. SLBN-35]|uniref:TadE/TadG family type IV pilus assembly protein n=1 Tax=Nocardioides sp. QY071 TaxID=3044187 RepID=UPI001151525C|nr:TadE/TadG family type IV pilus assembly protein [Nocardioides sp. QY071]TQK72058.1 TadE-like protein [Nocardioides sp. SLBN-35]WGY03755.1 pilus assembly protein [Nocardioides sp. QY071]